MTDKSKGRKTGEECLQFVKKIIFGFEVCNTVTKSRQAYIERPIEGRLMPCWKDFDLREQSLKYETMFYESI